MKKAKKVFISTSLIIVFSFVMCGILDLLFQGTIYNYYVDKAIACNYENDFMEIGLKYKNIGVVFSEINNYLYWILLFIITVWLIILAIKIVKHFVYLAKQSKSKEK